MYSLSGSLSAYIGAHTLPPTASEEVLIVETNDIVIHPDWNSANLRNDIALVRLAEPIQFTGIYDIFISFLFFKTSSNSIIKICAAIFIIDLF